VSPTVFQEKGFRFFFFSKEESRKHIHVYCGDGEAKFWLEADYRIGGELRFETEAIESSATHHRRTKR
jgi:hypothetical protein